MNILLKKVVAAKRKAAITRVTLTKTLDITINKLHYSAYFNNIDIYVDKIKNVFVKLCEKFDYGFKCNTNGGGKSGQADSVLYAMGKAVRAELALVHQDDDNQYKACVKYLRSLGIITLNRKIKFPKRYGRVKYNAKRQRPKR